jgi:hypothetical protein
VAASPFEPAGRVAGRFRRAELGREQSPDLADGERDEAGVGGRGVARTGRRGGLGVSAFPEQRGGDGADREGCHDQHDVPGDRGVEPGLALVQAEAALAGDLSPACPPIVQPFRDGRSLASAFTYFPACSQVSVRAKHDRSSPIRADRSRTAGRAPILATAAALYSFVLTSNMIPGRLPPSHENLPNPACQQVRAPLDAAVLGGARPSSPAI